MKKIRGYSTVNELGKYVKKALKQKNRSYRNNDDIFIVSVILTEIDRIYQNYKSGFLQNVDIHDLFSIPPNTNDERWDALLEGISLYYFNAMFRLTPPKWTYKTKLSKKFNPFNKLTKHNNDLYLDAFLQTPIEISEKNIILPAKEMKRM
jgi:hypothetical protein